MELSAFSVHRRKVAKRSLSAHRRKAVSRGSREKNGSVDSTHTPTLEEDTHTRKHRGLKCCFYEENPDAWYDGNPQVDANGVSHRPKPVETEDPGATVALML